MIEKIDPWVRGKKILLLGFGREGKSTWEVLRRLGTFQSVDIADQSAPGELPEDWKMDQRAGLPELSE